MIILDIRVHQTATYSYRETLQSCKMFLKENRWFLNLITDIPEGDFSVNVGKRVLLLDWNSKCLHLLEFWYRKERTESVWLLRYVITNLKSMEK